MGTLDLIMPYLLLGIHILLAGLGIIFVISGIDELVIDCTYIIDKSIVGYLSATSSLP